MKKIENIDQLFQEKFQAIDEIPSDNVWKNIKNSLKDDDKKRVIIPFWWKLAGTAAVFIAGIFIGNKFDTFSIIKENSNTDKTIVVESKKRQPNIKTNENRLATDDKISNKISNNQKNVAINKENSASENYVLSEKSELKSNLKNDRTNKILVQNKIKKASNSIFKKPVINENVIAVFNQKEKSSEIEILNTQNADLEKQTTLNEKQINNNLSNAENIDLMKITTEQESNKLATILDKTEEEKIKKKEVKTKKWQISSTVAPVFFGSTSNNSPVDSKLDNNSKKYLNSVSYGIGVNYNLTKKLIIRSAVNKLNLSYQTNDVVFRDNTSPVSSLNAVTATSNILFVPSPINNLDVSTTSGFIPPPPQNKVGSLAQAFDYYEVPLELSYAIIDKKIKVNLITGLSTLFLSNNNVALNSAEINQTIGEANNISKLNFSTNVGLGINHNFYQSFFINFDAVFKYQLNTFNGNANNFNPYIIGLYSGVGYQF